MSVYILPVVSLSDRVTGPCSPAASYNVATLSQNDNYITLIIE